MICWLRQLHEKGSIRKCWEWKERIDVSFSQAATQRMLQRKMAVCGVLSRHGEVKLGDLGKDIVLGFAT